MHPILLIEDDAELRATTREMLLASGYQVTAAADGSEAVRLLEESQLVPSLVLLDLVLPKLSGAELYAWMRERRELAEVPVLVVTASRSVDLPREVTAVLRKPVRPDRLLAVVDGLCGNSPVGRAQIASRARRLRMGGTGFRPS